MHYRDLKFTRRVLNKMADLLRICIFLVNNVFWFNAHWSLFLLFGNKKLMAFAAFVNWKSSLAIMQWKSEFQYLFASTTRWGSPMVLIAQPAPTLVTLVGWFPWELVTLRWRHNDHAGVSNHQPHGCLLNRLFRRTSKKTSKLRVTGLCAGNSPGTGEFPAQMASYAENVSIWWRHHVIRG